MATFLFWNIQAKPVAKTVATLCHTHDVDVLILAESKLSIVEMLEALNVEQEFQYRVPYNPSKRLAFYVRYPPDALAVVEDNGGVAIRLLNPPIGASVLLVAVHLPSKLHQSKGDQAQLATRLLGSIRAAEEKVGHQRTMVVGDLNMSPFEDGVVGSEALHAVMDRDVARQGSRIVQGEERRFMYNPMWSRLGDASPGPPGTYYYTHSGPLSYFWHAFDQVLLSPGLLDFYRDELAVLSEAGGQSLLTPRGLPGANGGPDHLPILFSLDLERGG